MSWPSIDRCWMFGAEPRRPRRPALRRARRAPAPAAGGRRRGGSRARPRPAFDVQPLHADQQQHLAVDVGERGERALEVAAARIVARVRPRRESATAVAAARRGDVGAPARRHEAIARHGEDPGRQIGVGRQPRRVPARSTARPPGADPRRRRAARPGAAGNRSSPARSARAARGTPHARAAAGGRRARRIRRASHNPRVTPRARCVTTKKSGSPVTPARRRRFVYRRRHHGDVSASSSSCARAGGGCGRC